MKKCQSFLMSTLMGLGIALVAPAAVADPLGLGYQDPLGWAGSGARINTFNPEYFNVISDVSQSANTTTKVDHHVYMERIDGWAESRPYILKGSIYAADTVDQWQAGGYFRDELYFATANGQPAELALTFSVAASGEVYTGGYAWLNLGISVPMTPLPPADWYYLSNQFLVNTTNEGSFGIIKSVTLRSTNPDYLVKSGTYLPFSVGLWGSVNEAYLEWGDTVMLESVNAYQGDIKLGRNEFTIVSRNGEPYFDDFTQGTLPVPEPEIYALMLTGLCLVGAMARRRKQVQA